MPYIVHFPTRARRDDPNGHMTVMEMLEFLAGEFQGAVAAEAYGSVTVANGATTASVTHDALPADHKVTASPKVDPGGRWWLSNITSTGFQVNLQTAAGIGGVPFDWIAKGGF